MRCRQVDGRGGRAGHLKLLPEEIDGREGFPSLLVAPSKNCFIQTSGEAASLIATTSPLLASSLRFVYRMRN